MVPRNMKGDKLFPLNELKNKYPKIYDEARKKYIGREKVMKQKVHYLNCLWNDCIHFTAVHPRKIIHALKKTGSPIKRKVKWFKINPSLLNPEKTIIYLYKPLPSNQRETKKNFTGYNPKLLNKYNKITQKTIDYYKKCYKEKRRPLLFVLIPHILHKGSINITKCEIIEV